MAHRKYCYLIIGLFSFACVEEVGLPAKNFVVEAFLYAGEPVNQITVKEIVPLESTETGGILITDAEVTITKNNLVYPLIFDNTISKYTYQGGDLEINSGDMVELTVVKGTRVAKAETIVPGTTTGLSISGNKMVIPPITVRLGIAQELQNLFNTARLAITWSNPDDDLHFVVIENVVEEDLIFPSDFPIPEATLNLIQSFRYISAPTTNTRFEIPGLSLETYGKYKGTVYRVNKEYADLYNNQVQDSRDLNPPPSNVRNALGIFSAFAGDSVLFEVGKY